MRIQIKRVIFGVQMAFYRAAAGSKIFFATGKNYLGMVLLSSFLMTFNQSSRIRRFHNWSSLRKI